MSVQPPHPDPDDPRPPELTPPVDPWSANDPLPEPASAVPQSPAYPPQAYPAPAPAYPAYPAVPAGGLPQPYPQAPYAYPQAYAHSPAHGSGQVRSLRVPARLATTGLALTLVYALFLELATPTLNDSFRTGSDDGLVVASFLGYAGVFLFTIVAFLTWLHRASTNLWNAGRPMKWRPGWTIGAWLIPIANLVLPLLVFREVDRQSRDHGPALFTTWAASWTVDLLLERYSGNVSDPTSGLYLLSIGAMPIAALAAILLVRRITADQEHLIQPQPF
jgi:hypothetical protein